ncbi:MAG: CinA family protein [Saezia sp.]
MTSLVEQEPEFLLSRLSAQLLAKNQLLCTAESCTGGLIAAYCTEIAGSSQWFERGFVTYSNAAKHHSIGVPENLIKKYGAVSQEVAKAMATGALAHSQAHWSIAVTGIAGPSGGSLEKPVGLVWSAFAWRTSLAQKQGFNIYSESNLFDGDRHSIRQATVKHVFNVLARLMDETSVTG